MKFDGLRNISETTLGFDNETRMKHFRLDCTQQLTWKEAKQRIDYQNIFAVFKMNSCNPALTPIEPGIYFSIVPQIELSATSLFGLQIGTFMISKKLVVLTLYMLLTL